MSNTNTNSNRWTFGYSLQSSSRAIGWVDIVFELMGIAANINSLVPHSRCLNFLRNKHISWYDFKHVAGEYCEHPEDADLPQEIGLVVVSVASLLVHIIELFLIYILIRGAQQRDAPQCTIWARLTGVLTIVDTLILIAHLILDPDIFLIIFIVLNDVFKSYAYGVVTSFATESRTYNDVPGNNSTPENKISLIEYHENMNKS